MATLDAEPGPRLAMHEALAAGENRTARCNRCSKPVQNSQDQAQSSAATASPAALEKGKVSRPNAFNSLTFSRAAEALG
ncbi:hypothetical protein MTsN3n11_15570 [Qipengyuania sp. MTN3-11]